mmetsp:Transcript_3602/g.6831  ORF Transcript_3602/g.6831 Transcript_3602/m.6831 type:complete len:213 (-) Transcript_3602:697-1335(-)
MKPLKMSEVKNAACSVPAVLSTGLTLRPRRLNSNREHLQSRQQVPRPPSQPLTPRRSRPKNQPRSLLPNFPLSSRRTNPQLLLQFRRRRVFCRPAALPRRGNALPAPGLAFRWTAMVAKDVSGALTRNRGEWMCLAAGSWSSTAPNPSAVLGRSWCWLRRPHQTAKLHVATITGARASAGLSIADLRLGSAPLVQPLASPKMKMGAFNAKLV